MYREISRAQAQAVLRILVETCGYRVIDPRDGEAFVWRIATKDGGPEWDRACREYRFQGALGFGGKFRNNGNCDNTPHVDCYPEDETPERLKMIAAANEQLAALFGPSS